MGMALLVLLETFNNLDSKSVTKRNEHDPASL